MNFETFITNLPDCVGSQTLPIMENPEGFRYIDKGLPEFVGPDLLPSSMIEQPSKSQIVIISAAGAVGKSTLAKEIAFRKHAPIWDLAQAPAVGNNSMKGQLAASFDFAHVADVNQALIKNKLFLIVDALDEARVKANEAGFEAFIANIAEVAKTVDGASLILLGRTQTAETTWLLLDSAGVSASLISIQPFTREQAERYIEARIQNFDTAAAKRILQHKQPFIDARDLILDHLEKAVAGENALKDGVAREFLGYAPVLETVAVLLARESNYQEFSKKLMGTLDKQGARQPNNPLGVLNHVVTHLLEREKTDKLQVNIKPALEKVAKEAGWNAWETLYSPDEQVIRLLGKVLSCKVDAAPKGMPDIVRVKYEEQLNAWLPEHPFLRDGSIPTNKVFESYLFAYALQEHLTFLSISAEKRVCANDYKPSRLLADFYILIGEQRHKEEIPDKHIGLLYDSLLAGETDSLHIRLSIESGDPEEDEAEKEENGEGEFELIYASSDAGKPERIERRTFQIAKTEGKIRFLRQLKEAAIVTNGTVALGGDVDDFEIGPTVDIRCSILEIYSTGLVVRATGKSKSLVSDEVILETHNCSSAVSKRPVVRGSLSVSWPGVRAFPWSDFAVESLVNDVEDKLMHEAYMRFKRIVTSLRSHSRGSLARFKGKMENRRVLKNDVGTALLKQLLEDGVMELKDEFYYWRQDRADDVLKVSWHDIRHNHITPNLKDYLQTFIKKYRALFK